MCIAALLVDRTFPSRCVKHGGSGRIRYSNIFSKLIPLVTATYKSLLKTSLVPRMLAIYDTLLSVFLLKITDSKIYILIGFEKRVSSSAHSFINEFLFTFPSLKLASAIFSQIFIFHPIKTLQKLWNMFFHFILKNSFGFRDIHFFFLYFHLPVFFSLPAIALERHPR